MLVDQRGTGRSSPLVCAAFKPDHSLEAALEFDPVPKAQRLRAGARREGHRRRAIHDGRVGRRPRAVRAALGYDKINLWGGSYGTRAAQEYLRRYPDRVRSVVLDGVAPPAMKSTLDVWPTREAALAGVFDACARVAGLRAAPSRSFGTRSTRFATSWAATGAMSC